MLGSAFMAVGGAFLTISVFDAFYIGMVNGRCWISIALVIFASWRPGNALAGALHFAALGALPIRVHQADSAVFPYPFFHMRPHSLSLPARIVMSRRVGNLQALLVPLRQGKQKTG